jgi:DNA-binding transcriptional LysR family regulator
MKKLLAFTLIALLAIAAWNSIDTSDMVVNIDGEEFSGPMGALLGLVFGGIGLLIGAVVVTCVAVFVGFLMAGLGILMVAGLALAAVIMAAVVAPLTLPLLIPVAIIWYIASRNRKQRDREQALKQQPAV